MSITRSSPVQVAAFSTTYSQAPKLVSTSWSKISVGPSHVLAIKSNNTLWSWGINTNGQIGDGTTISRSSPVQLGNPGYTWNEAVAGINYSVAVRGDGLLFTWGLNASGVLGDLNAGTTARSSPIQIGTSSWVAVSAGGTHVVAIRSDKSLWAWGLNTSGQLGTSDYFTRSSPVQVSSSSWIQISAGNTHTTAITSNGKLFTWGDNTVGTLGYTTPAQTTYSWTSVAGNVEYTVAIRNDGLLFAWGTNQFGQLGDGTTIPRSSPVQIGTSSWSVVTANALSGGGPTLAIRSDGTLWGWGYNVTGVLGIGDTAYRSSPVQVSGGGSWTKVAASKSHALAINSVGTLYTWGLGTSGQLGLGLSTRTIPIPVTVSGTVNSIYVNGTSSQWISFPAGASTSGDLGAGDFTLECWTYLLSRTTLYPIIFDNGGTPSTVTNRILFTAGHNSVDTTKYNLAIASIGQLNFTSSIIYNAWTHLALVRIGTTIKLYVNGIADATVYSPTSTNLSGTTTAYIGGSAADAANCSLNGLISNFRIIRGQGIYTGTFTPSTSQLTTTTIGSTGAGAAASVTGTVSLLTAQSSTFVDNSSTNSTITLSGSPIITPGLVPFSGQVLTKTSYTQISAGDLSSYAIRLDGKLFAWGSNSNGQQGDPAIATTILRSSPTQIGSNSWNNVFAYGSTFVHAIDSNYKLFAWGVGGSGQLGYNDIISRSSPVQISSGNWSTLAVFSTAPTALAIQTDGSLWAWGLKTNLLLGEFSNASYTYSWSQVSAGPSHTAAIRSDGRLYTWGLNSSGQIGNNTVANTSSPTLITTTPGGAGEYWNRVSVNGLRTVGILSDGTLWAWGSNAGYLLGDGTSVNRSAPVQITSVSESWNNVSAGLSHTLAISNLGRLYAWGNNTTQQLGIGSTDTLRSQPVQIGSSSWSQVNSYGNHSLGIDINNMLYGWGDNTLGQIGIGSSPLQYIFASTNHTVAIIRNDGVPYLVGLNNGGQIGDSSIVSRSSPVQISGGGSWSQIVSGWDTVNNGYSVGIKTNGTLYTWGRNSGGVLGDSALSTTVTRSSPVQVGTNSWISVSTNNNNILAIRSDYTLWAWGLNSSGQLGVGDTVARSSPVQVGTSSWMAVSVGYETSMGLRIDGSLFSWGNGIWGQIGDNTAVSKSSPVQIGIGNSYLQISSNPHQFAIRIDGTLWGWGRNDYGQIGDNTQTYRSSPVQVDSNNRYDSISNGFDISVGKRKNGTIWSWGYNNGGQLGLNDTVNRFSPVQIGTSSWVSISAGYESMFGITVSGINGLQNVYSWGYNNYGQLGLNDRANRSSPTQVGTTQLNQYVSSPTQIGTSSWTSISAGLSNSFAIRSDYKLFSWGDNSQLQSGYITPATILGTGSNPNNNAQSYIRNTDNALIIWGINSSGEIGDGTTINRSSPVQLGLGLGYSQFAKIARAKVANLVYTLGVKTDGTLWSWGSNTGGQLGIGLTTSRSSPVQVGTLSNWSDVAAGPSHALAIKSDGSLWGWGINTNGQIGDNTTVNRSSPVQIGTSSWTAVSAGSNFSTAIRTDGGLFTWGFGTQGQLGSGLTTARSNPVQVGIESYTSISSGGSHAVALRTDLTLYAWGLNNAGQLGDNSTTNRSSPVQVNTGLVTSWNLISAGASHSMGTDATYNIPYGWGLNSSGQIGDNTLINRSAPVQVSVGITNNYSYQFNGTTQYLTLPSSSLFAYGSGDYTIECWFYLTAAGGSGGTLGNVYQYIYVGQDASSYGPIIRFGNSGYNYYLQFTTYGPGVSNTRNVNLTQVQALNTWYHVALIKQSGIVYMYLNGVRQATSSGTSSSFTGTSGYTDPYVPIAANAPSIGAIVAGGFFNGYISNLRVVKGTALYTTGFYPSAGALTTTSQGAIASQVSLLTAQSATIADNSINTFTITNTGTVAASITNPFGPYYSASFNGNNLSIPASSAFETTGDITIECWVYQTSRPTTGVIYDNYDYISILTSGAVRLLYHTPTNTIFQTTGAVSLNIWTHIAFVRSGSNLKFYINGVADASTATFSGTIGSSGSAPYIGSDPPPTGAYFYGYISNLRVVKSAVYTGNFTVPTNILRTTQSASTNIVALTGTETSLLTLQNATIVDNSTNVFTITNNGSVSITTAYAPFSASTAGSTTTWDSIIAGVTSTMGTSNNTLFTWGAGTTGQLGDNTITGKSAPTATGVGSIWSVAEKLFSSPVQVGTAKSWSLISTGGSHAVATATDNSLWSWGVNNIGQFGDNTTVSKSSPTQIASNTSSYTFVTAGVSNTFAVRSTTALLFAWGQNNVGQIGDASTVAGRSSPVQVFAGTMTSPLIPIKLSTVSGSSYTQVQAGSAASVIDSTGRLYAWGTNTNGQVGDNTVISRSSPVQVGGIQTTYINSPTQVGASSWSQVSAGSSHTLAIDSNSLLYAWGKTPANGQSVNRSSPVQIGANSWINVSTGNDLSLATDSAKTLYTWGLNTNYQLGSPNFYLNQSVTSPVAIGTMAIVQSETTSGGAGNGGFIKNI